MELADRVAILNAGQIEQVGRPGDIYATPSSAFVAAFMGDATTLDVTLVGGRVRLGRFDIGVAQEPLNDGPARLFLRASDVTLVPLSGEILAQGERSRADIPARVVDLVWTSRGVRAAVTIEGMPLPFDVEGPRQWHSGIGSTVVLRFERLTLFR